MMADITKCIGRAIFGDGSMIECEKRQRCYRFTANDSTFWQSYFVGVPVKIIEGRQECEQFDPT